MKKLKKEYLRSKLDLSVAVTKKHSEDWEVVLDPKIEDTVALLQCHGFQTVMSCEGHCPPYKKVDTFRLFYPYVQIELIHNTVFHLEGKTPRLETVSGDPFKNFSKAKELITEFNFVRHPYFEEHLEMDIVLAQGSSLLTSLELDEALKKHWGIKALICDKGVPGLFAMPQEFLNDPFRKKFLKRTQHQMNLFTKFLEWKYLHQFDEE